MTNGDLALDSCMCDESVGVVWPPVSRTGSSAGLYPGHTLGALRFRSTRNGWLVRITDSPAVGPLLVAGLSTGWT